MPTPEKGEHWGILGGTFDPVHRGHTTLARDIHSKKPLDGVLLVPAYRHPFKKGQAVASYEDRLEMLKLAVSSQDFFIINEIEKDSDLSGYTLDTVRALKRGYPGVTFYFLVGADNIASMALWHKPEEILNEMAIIAGTRPSFSPEQATGPLASAIEYIETTPVDVSSSGIRDAIGKGTELPDLAKWFDPGVFEYILSRGLYK